MAKPKVALDPSCLWQPDMDVAALTGLLRAPGGRAESAGAIYKNANGEYCYSTLAPGDNDSFGMVVQVPEGAQLAGTFHTHPTGSAGDGDSRLFSNNDVSVAKALGVPSYVRSQHDGLVRRFTPNQSHVEFQRRGGKLTASAQGDLVTNAIVAALRNQDPEGTPQ